MGKEMLKRQLRTPGRAKQSVSGARWSRWTSIFHPLLCQMASTAAHSQVAFPAFSQSSWTEIERVTVTQTAGLPHTSFLLLLLIVLRT